MTVTAAMIAQVRRMVAETSASLAYTDEVITAYIEKYPLIDERGVAPYWWDTSTTPPTQTATEGWIPVYCLYSAAADVWDEKAAGLWEEHDYPVEGTQNGVQRHSQKYDHAAAQARKFRARRAMRTATAIAWPSRNIRGDQWVGNLAELDR